MLCDQAGIKQTGAGASLAEALTPAILDVPAGSESSPSTAWSDSIGFGAPVGVRFHKGTVYDVLAESERHLGSRDAYVVGPSKTVAAVVEVLLRKGVPLEHVQVDSYGL